MNSKTASPALSPLAILFVALALSIGWGVRGNWGHEYGAMIPGALAAMLQLAQQQGWLGSIKGEPMKLLRGNSDKRSAFAVAAYHLDMLKYPT